MKIRLLLKRAFVPALLVAAFGTTAAHAVTLDFDGSVDEADFVLTDAQLVSGNCGPSGPQCLALNNNASTSVTADDGGAFSAVSFFFELLGQGTDNTLIV